MNEHAIAALDAYLGREHPVPHAFLLEGPWGVGKTYFVERYFEARKRRLDRPIPLHKAGTSEPIHVSLFGLRNATDIQRRILEIVSPVGVEAAALVGVAAAGTRYAMLTSVVTERWEGSISQRLSGRVLIFDDLERCEAELGEVMGFINLIVEEHRRHVVVLANEKEMRSLYGKEWDRRCEKLIGRRARLRPVPEAILQARAASPIVTDYRDVILDAFRRSKLGNMRSLAWALENAERVANALPDTDFPDGHKNAIIGLVAAVTMEVRGGRLKVTDLARIEKYTMRSVVRSMNERSGNAKLLMPYEKRVKAFIRRYHPYEPDHPKIGYAFVRDLEVSGTIDRHGLADWLAERFGIGAQEKMPAWRRAWYRSNLEPDELDATIEELADDLAQRRLTQLGEILHAAGLSIALAKAGDVRLTNGERPLDYFPVYAVELRQAGRLERDRADDPHHRFTFDSGYGGLGYASIKDPEFKAIFDAIVAESQRASHEQRLEAVEAIFDEVRADPPNVAALDRFHVVQDELKLYARPVLAETSPEAFADLMASSVARLAAVRKFIAYRYNDIHAAARLAPEAAWALAVIEKVRVLIEQRFSDPVRTVQLEALDGWLEETLPKLERVATELSETDHSE